MKIVTVPHPSLRKKAQPVTKIDKKITTLVSDLKSTLGGKKNPAGVGLAAPQVNKNYRIFCTNLPSGNDVNDDDESKSILKIFINPIIITHSKEISLGPDLKYPTLEGCLSIPNLYGPIPRWTSIELQYDRLIDGKLETIKDSFSNFSARVIQHELDHLDGILFTDYSLEYDLPLYSEDKKTKKLIEVDKKMIEIF